MRSVSAVFSSATGKMSGSEGIETYDEIKERKSDFEIYEDERRWSKICTFKKKAINASNKFTHSLKKRGKRKVDYRVPSVSLEDVHDAKEEQAVNELREKLLDRDLLPATHDDYHTLIRFLKATDFNIEKTVQMWEEMLSWRREYGADTILEGRHSDTTMIESGSDADDPCSPSTESSFRFPQLTPVHEARLCDSPMYYSCNDYSSQADRDIGNDQEVGVSPSLKYEDEEDVGTDARTHSEGAVREKFVKRSLQYLTRATLPVIKKLLIFISFFPSEYLRRQNDIHPSGNRHEDFRGQNNDLPSNASENRPEDLPSVSPEALNEEDRVLPYIERLQRLENLIEELNKKPTEIPLNKEQLLQQSVDRIKSVECDLDKTKRVLHDTIMNQLEIADFLENTKESKFWLSRCFAHHQRRGLLCR